MARKRMLDPSWLESHSLGKCNHMTRLLFLGMISLADDEGRLRGHPVYLRNTIFPYDDISVADIVKSLDRLRLLECIVFYIVGDDPFIFLPKWKTYQRVDHPADSALPAPPKSDGVTFKNHSGIIREWFENYSGSIRGNELINELINQTSEFRESGGQSHLIQIDSKTIEMVYSKYPARCPIRLRSTGKSAKNKEKIKALLKNGQTAETLINIIELYQADCIKNETYMKNFSTFLNNLPDLAELEKRPEPRKENDADYFIKQGNAGAMAKKDQVKPLTAEQKKESAALAADLAKKFKV